MSYTVNYTIIKNPKGIPTGRFKKRFMTKYGANKFILELMYSKKRVWYKYARNIKAPRSLMKLR